MRTARQLLEQRDRLLAELQASRRDNDRLLAQLRAASVEKEELERRAASAEEEAQALRQELAKRVEAEAAPPPPRAPDADAIARLSRRIEELTGDLDRVQRRTTETVADARRDERIRLLAGLGEVLDSVERALTMGEAEGPWRQGLEGIRSQLHAYLKGEGAHVTGEVGQKMDPHRHQALAAVDAPDAAPGTIVHVDRQGIELDDGTIVRPAQVIVAR